MRRMNAALCSLAIALSVSLPCAQADAFQAEVLPPRISPGDAFTVRVTGVKDGEIPTAFLAGTEVHFAWCGEGCFFAVGAVDIETKPGTYKIAVTAGKKKRSLRIVVKREKFPWQVLTLPEEKVSLSPDDLARADIEAERLRALWLTVTDKAWDGGFVFPLDNSISTAFGTRRIINREKTSIHRGIDMRGKEGDAVRASNRGRVALTEELFFGGNTLVVDHGLGIFTVYMHLSAFNAKPGDVVSKGDVVGFVGSSGRSSGPHLHFGVKVQDISVNPVSFMKLRL